jgi:hypothetical protein
MYRKLFHNASKSDYALLSKDYQDMGFFLTATTTLIKKTNAAIKKKEINQQPTEKGEFKSDTDRMRLDFLKFLKTFILNCGLFFQDTTCSGLFSACSEANFDFVLDKFVTAVHSAIFGTFETCTYHTEEEGDEKQIIPFDKKGNKISILNSF